MGIKITRFNFIITKINKFMIANILKSCHIHLLQLTEHNGTQSGHHKTRSAASVKGHEGGEETLEEEPGQVMSGNHGIHF